MKKGWQGKAGKERLAGRLAGMAGRKGWKREAGDACVCAYVSP